MIKDIIVNLPLRAAPDVVPSFAVSVANNFGAHLTGVAFVYEPILVGAEMGASVPVEYIDAQEAESKELADAAVSRLQSAARLVDIGLDTLQVKASAAGAPKRFAEMARRFDLAVVGQAKPDASAIDGLFVEETLFDSGRPVLVVPYTQRDPLKLDRIAICWDGSRPAARAVADAMPFLKKASAVDIMVAKGERAKSDEMPAADIAQHIARYGLNVEVHRVVTTIDIASTILNFAADRSTDLLIMGGYGHTRLREFVLGGATLGILNSMTVPTLMSH